MAWPASAPAWDILNELLYGAYRQFLAYNTNLFNQNTMGGLLLSTGPDIQGDYEKMSYFKSIAGLVKDRDITADTDLSKVSFEMDNLAMIKYAKGTPLVELIPHQWDWILKDPKEGMTMLAEQLAEQTLADNLATAVNALVAANTNVGATLVYDGTAGTATLTGLTNTANLWGDRSSNVACWVMHSKTFNDLQLAGLTNAQNLFKFGDVNFMRDQTGRPFIVTDLPSLVYTSSGTKYHVLGLSAGAVKIEAGQEFRSLFQEIGGKENIKTTWQSQWTNNIEPKGFGWNTGAVARNPTTAQLGTGTNWTKKAVSVKDCGAVLGNFQ